MATMRVYPFCDAARCLQARRHGLAGAGSSIAGKESSPPSDDLPLCMRIMQLNCSQVLASLKSPLFAGI